VFTEDQKRALVALARDAVKRAAGVAGATVTIGADLDGLPAASGAFVTIKRAGRLRGCIGTLQCRASLADEIARVAVSAAREDPRFAPLQASEVHDVEIEVSVLGPLEPIDPHDASAIEIGRHGLVVEEHHRRGLLLPQVAAEHGWDRAEFLSQTCVKAGLPPDAWRCGAVVYRFDAIVFGD